MDPENCVPLARVCHDKATNEDPQFYAAGLVVHSWDGQHADGFPGLKNSGEAA